MNKNYQYSEITEYIIKAFYKVYNTLGYGFLEKVYENAMALELRKMGLECVQQASIVVYYDGNKVGSYNSDLLVERKVIAELKSAITLAPDHEAQLLNYLKATEHEVGMLLNFGPKPQIVRKVFSNEYKAHRADITIKDS
jgi:GxxExxY protein